MKCGMKCKIKCTFCNIFISQPCSINANGCCWCHDKRTPDNINKRYIDSYGDIDVRRLGLTYPKDIFYCPGCKKSPHTTATFDVLVKITYTAIKVKNRGLVLTKYWMMFKAMLNISN
jgi:hypothetical protein